MAYRKRMKKQAEDLTDTAPEELEGLNEDPTEFHISGKAEEVFVESEPSTPKPEVFHVVESEPEVPVAKVQERRRVVKKFPRNTPKFSR